MNELLEILNEMHPNVDFETQERLIDDKLLSSFDIVSLVAAIQGGLDVTIPPEEIVPENFNSAKMLWALIERVRD